MCLGWYKTAEEAQSVVDAWKEVHFRIKYLSFCSNDLHHWYEDSRRAFIHADKASFTKALKFIDLRVKRYRSLRKAMRLLLDDYPTAAASLQI